MCSEACLALQIIFRTTTARGLVAPSSPRVPAPCGIACITHVQAALRSRFTADVFAFSPTIHIKHLSSIRLQYPHIQQRTFYHSKGKPVIIFPPRRLLLKFPFCSCRYIVYLLRFYDPPPPALPAELRLDYSTLKCR